MLPTSAPPPPPPTPPPPTPSPPTPLNDWCQEATPSSSNHLVVLEDPTGGNIRGQARARSTHYTSNGAVSLNRLRY
ncbi:unnamed protein product [Ectocarpus sp. 6 AP-2014]